MGQHYMLASNHKLLHVYQFIMLNQLNQIISLSNTQMQKPKQSYTAFSSDIRSPSIIKNVRLQACCLFLDTVLNVHRKGVESVYGAFHYQSPKIHSQGQIFYHVSIKMLTEKYEIAVCIYQLMRENQAKMQCKNNNSKLVTAGWEKYNFKNMGWDRKVFEHWVYYVLHLFHTLHGSFVRNDFLLIYFTVM